MTKPDATGCAETIAHRLRVGETTLARVEEAARLGHEGASIYTQIAPEAERDLDLGIALLCEREQRLLAADYAEAVLPLFQEARPEDDRPRKAILAARLYAWGRIDDAARAAARDAAWAAARDAAWAAAWDAAWAAARDAARAAVRDAARAAARDAAWAAAWDAAWAAAWDAAWAAARVAARESQRRRLSRYLTGEVTLWSPCL